MAQQPINTDILLAPDAIQQQLKLERNKQLAQALMQESMSNPQTQFAGGMAVKQSPLEGLSRIAQALIAKHMNAQNDATASSIQQSRMDGLSKLFGGAPAASPQGQQDQPVTPGFPGLGGGQPQQPSGPQLAQALSGGQGGPLSMQGMTPQQSQLAWMLGGPEEYMKQWMASKSPTDAAKRDAELGIDTGTAKAGALNKMALQVRQNGMAITPDGRVIYAPSQNGSVQLTQGANGIPVANQIPGAAAASQQMALANAIGAGTGHAATTLGPVMTAPDGSTHVNTLLNDITQAGGGGVAGGAGGVKTNPVAPTKATGGGIPLQNPADAAGAKSAAELSGKIPQQLQEESDASQNTQKIMNQLENHLASLDSTGKLASTKAFMANWKVALGVGSDEDKAIASNSAGADKVSTQLAAAMAKAMTSRGGTQFDFKTDMANVPNKDLTDPRALIKDMREVLRIPVEKNQAFQDFKKTHSAEEYADFPAYWAKLQQQKLDDEAAKINSPSAQQIQGGTTNPAIQDLLNKYKR